MSWDWEVGARATVDMFIYSPVCFKLSDVINMSAKTICEGLLRRFGESTFQGVSLTVFWRYFAQPPSEKAACQQRYCG